MKFVIDENLHGALSNLLNASGHETYSISLNHQGISDREIIALVRDWGMPIITEDKDFGELVFAHNLKDVSIIFLRYQKTELESVGLQLLKAINFLIDAEGRFFITITSKKIRITKL